MVIAHNLSAHNANRMYGIMAENNAKLAEKLSSGYRINRGADDAAGLSISEKMRRQIRGLDQAVMNAQDGISLVQSAEGALWQMHEIAQRGNELAIKAANGTMSDEDRELLDKELQEIKNALNDAAHSTVFNEMRLFPEDGETPGGTAQTSHVIKLQVGAETGVNIEAKLYNMDAEALGLKDTNVKTIEDADQAIEDIKTAIQDISNIRGYYGSIQNRLEHTVNNLNNVIENTTAAESLIRDSDMAKLMVQYANSKILLQAGQAVLAQANQSKAYVLELIRGART